MWDAIRLGPALTRKPFSSIRRVRVRYANSGRRRILVTDGHEAQAKAAQRRKRPNRIGLLVLRVLGLRSKRPPLTGQGDLARPSHKHPGRYRNGDLSVEKPRLDR
jgi:hypothetical protein